MRSGSQWCVLLLCVLASPPSRAEGLTNLGEVLYQDTELLLDVISEDEVIEWLGPVRVEIYDQDNTWVGTLGNKERTGPLGIGTYTLLLSDDVEEWWQATVIDETGNAMTGRLHSYRWHLDNSSSAPGWTFNFYLVVPLGDGSTQRLFKTDMRGVGGDNLTLAANRTGVLGQHARSVEQATGEVVPEYPLYVSAPIHLAASTGADTPTLTISEPDYTGEGLCPAAIIPGETIGTFSVDTNLDGVLLLTCDADDGSTPTYDRSGYSDLILLESVEAGRPSVSWAGLDADGAPMEAGPYSCLVEVLQGSTHLLLGDADSAYDGVRLMSDSGSDFGPNQLMWNDVLVQSSDERLSYDLGTPLISSGGEGVSSLLWSDEGIVNENNHAWGDIEASDLGSKGSEAWMDTWTWVERATSSSMTVEVIDPDADSDLDSLTDAIERCLLGTAHDAADSDGDGLPDGDEVGDIYDPLDTDDDGEINALDDDDDGDSILTATEKEHGEQHGDDVDSDNIPNWHDTDSDGDTIPDSEEAEDADNSGVPDYLEPASGGTDSAAASLSGQGVLSGGACGCAGVQGSAGLWLLATLALVRRRQPGT